MLLLLGHGSSKHPESSTSVREHAEILRAQGSFSEVHCAFLKEEPFIQDALGEIISEHITIVPDFLAEGYFTQEVIPQLLGDLPDHATYSAPVGTHPLMRELILAAADAHLGDWLPSETSLIVIGHGSNKNKNSQQTLLDHIAKLRKTSPYAQVEDLWLEEPPYAQDWQKIATQKQVIVVPFLLSNGQHGGWDIPQLLGDAANLRLTPALGTSARFTEAIEAVARPSAPL